MMSRTSSMPIERRTNSGVTPVCACSSGVSCEWVVVAGWMISDFASPMFARWLNSLTLLISFRPASLPPLMPKPTIAALSVGQVLLHVGVVGMAGQARDNSPTARPDAFERNSATARAFCECRSIRRCSVSRPSSVRNAPNGLWRAPVSRSQCVRM